MKLQQTLRFLTVSIATLSVCFYNFLYPFSAETPIKTGESTATLEEISSSSEEKEEQAEDKKESETGEQKATESILSSDALAVETDTSAIKGKVLSQHISPYSAGLSYNGVYIKNSTGESINIAELLSSKISFEIKENDEPQVLILHTHATETYLSSSSEYYTENYTSRTTDNDKNMVKLGKIVAEKLNAAGIKTLQSTIHHDYPQYSGSYSRAAETICEYLEKYPSIKVVIDLHRDAISSGSDKVKFVTEVNGKNAAQVMLVMGSGTGGVTNFPNWQENLKLALRLQQKLESRYPALARPLSLVSKNYNESLTTGSMLIEIGTDANSIEEAFYSAELLAECLCELLKEI